MTLSLSTKIVEVLKRNNQKLSAREIANFIVQDYSEYSEEKILRSKGRLKSKVDLIDQIQKEISAHKPALQRKYPQVKCNQERPRLYYWSVLTDEQEVESAETNISSMFDTLDVGNSKEYYLYPKLQQFLHSEDQNTIFSMRIDEKTSSNNQGPKGNEWLHPDVVGIENMMMHWDRRIQDCFIQAGERKARLWSFEVKKLINKSNARKAFFQAVSNSSWANLGYLVAESIDENAYKELRILSVAHGIGIILLDKETPEDSQIMIPAQENTEVDWNMCNRLVIENKNFSEFIGRLKRFYQTGELSPLEWRIPKSS